MTTKKKATKKTTAAGPERAPVSAYEQHLWEEWALFISEAGCTAYQFWRIVVDGGYLIASLWNTIVQIAALGTQAVPVLNRIAGLFRRLKL